MSYELSVVVRDPDRWLAGGKELLEELLGFMGNARWTVSFTRRRSNACALGEDRSDRAVSRVALFSGGLDSTSGVAGGAVLPADTQLCGFYTKQKSLQADLAAELGYHPPTQWRQAGGPGVGRAFLYRSLFLLALGAAVADSWGAREIVQFENGVLGTAAAPIPSMMMTRHAHPRTHDLFGRLLSHIIGGQWRVTNPFLRLTKRQCYSAMQHARGKSAHALAARTRSCWNLQAPHAYGVRTVGRRVKLPGAQCGVCVPCIIRRTALPNDTFSFDLNARNVRREARLTSRLLAYGAFVDDIRTTTTPGQLRRALPFEVLELLDGGWLSFSEVETLFRRFAAEFEETFA